MAEYQLRVVMPYRSGLPADVAVNTFNIIVTGEPTAGAFDLLKAFYNTATAGADPLATYMSNYLDRAANRCRFEAYEIDLATGLMGTPTAVVPWTLGAVAADTDDLPLEVALCGSFAAGAADGVPAARRKGRVYVGPWNTSAIRTDLTTEYPAPSGQIRNAIAAASKRLVDGAAEAGVPLCVYSRKDKALYPIVRGWVDDAWDTQRRRGNDATARTRWDAGD